MQEGGKRNFLPEILFDTVSIIHDKGVAMNKTSHFHFPESRLEFSEELISVITSHMKIGQ